MIDHILWITLLCFAFFAKSLCYKYVSDDIPSSRRTHSQPRWLHWLFVLEGRERSNPQTDRLITIVTHWLVCVGIYLGFGANQTSFIAALLMAINPANNQVSVWISGRAYGYVALGMVWAMYIPVLAPVLFFFITYFSFGFAIPVVFFGTEHSWVALTLPLAWVFHMKRFKKNVGEKITQEMFAEDRKVHWGKVVLFIKTLGFYAVHGLIPVKNSFYHSYLQSAAGSMKDKAYSIRDRFFWLGLGWFGFIGYSFITRPWDLFNLGLLWWLIGIAPFGNFCRIHQEISERYMYIPNVGLMYCLATLIMPIPGAVVAFMTMYATKLWFYMDCYQDDYYLVENASLNAPDAWFAWHIRGLKRWDAGSHQEAVIMWTMARMISPKEYKVNWNISTALALSNNAKHQEEALKFHQIAMDNVPGGQEETARKLDEDWHNNKKAILL